MRVLTPRRYVSGTSMKTRLSGNAPGTTSAIDNPNVLDGFEPGFLFLFRQLFQFFAD